LSLRFAAGIVYRAADCLDAEASATVQAALGALAQPHSDFILGEPVQSLGKRVLVAGRFRAAVCQAAFSLIRIGSSIGYAAADCYARLRFRLPSALESPTARRIVTWW
jgi:hypothetical protein